MLCLQRTKETEDWLRGRNCTCVHIPMIRSFLPSWKVEKFCSTFFFFLEESTVLSAEIINGLKKLPMIPKGNIPPKFLLSKWVVS